MRNTDSLRAMRYKGWSGTDHVKTRHTLILLVLCVCSQTSFSFADSSSRKNPEAEQVIIDSALMARHEAIEHVRIVLHAQEAQWRLATQIAHLLSALGVQRVEKRIVDETPTDYEVRYYYAVDREAAILLQETLARVFETVSLRDFTHFKPPPRPSLIEVWL